MCVYNYASVVFCYMPFGSALACLVSVQLNLPRRQDKRKWRLSLLDRLIVPTDYGRVFSITAGCGAANAQWFVSWNSIYELGIVSLHATIAMVGADMYTFFDDFRTLRYTWPALPWRPGNIQYYYSNRPKEKRWWFYQNTFALEQDVFIKPGLQVRNTKKKTKN